MVERDVPASAQWVAWRGEAKSVTGQPLVEEIDRERGECLRLGGDCVDAGLGRDPGALERSVPGKDRWRTHQEPVDGLDWIVGRTHRELVALREPSPDRLPQLVLQVGAHV